MIPTRGRQRCTDKKCQNASYLMGGSSASSSARYSITFCPPPPRRPAFQKRHLFLGIQDSGLRVFAGRSARFTQTLGVLPEEPRDGDQMHDRRSAGGALGGGFRPPRPQHQVLVFIAPSWRDLLTWLCHTLAARSWCHRRHQPESN